MACVSLISRMVTVTPSLGRIFRSEGGGRAGDGNHWSGEQQARRSRNSFGPFYEAILRIQTAVVAVAAVRTGWYQSTKFVKGGEPAVLEDDGVLGRPAPAAQALSHHADSTTDGAKDWGTERGRGGGVPSSKLAHHCLQWATLLYWHLVVSRRCRRADAGRTTAKGTTCCGLLSSG